MIVCDGCGLLIAGDSPTCAECEDAARLAAIAFLRGVSSPTSDEEQVQEAIAAPLSALGFQREVVLPGDAGRIDFLHPFGIGIEVKLKGSVYLVEKQLRRYLGSALVTHVILATMMDVHRILGSANVTAVRIRRFP